jgi:hypothetical protein
VSYGFIKTSASEPSYLALFNSQRLGYVQNTISAGIRYSY